MPDAVTSFISGAVPAVALWVPFNITVRDKVPGARKLVDASAYYPQAAIMSGWATTADFHAKNREVLVRLVKAWAAGNEYLTGKTDEALEVLQKKQYPQVPLADFKEQYGAQKAFPAAEWRKLYSDGTVTKWLQQVTDFFVVDRQHPQPDPGLAVLRSVDLHGRHQELSLASQGLRLHHRRRRFGGLRARQPAVGGPGLPRAAAGGRRPRPQFLAEAAGRLFPHHLRRALLAPVPDRALGRHGGARHRVAARPRARRLELDQRTDLHPRPARGLRRLGAGRRRGLGLPRRAPHFRKLESFDGAPSQYRGAHGPLHVSTLRNDHPACRAWVEAARQLGLPANADFNGATTYGVGSYQLSIGKRWRESAAVAFLRPAMARPNLTVITAAHATRITLEGSRAVGVEWVARRQQAEPRARSAR